jgi:hypothetical protein
LTFDKNEEVLETLSKYYAYAGLSFYHVSPTDRRAEIAATMIHEILKCSRAMDKVPTPTGNPSVAWVLSSAVRAVISKHDSRVTKACVLRVAQIWNIELYSG